MMHRGVINKETWLSECTFLKGSLAVQLYHAKNLTLSVSLGVYVFSLDNVHIISTLINFNGSIYFLWHEICYAHCIVNCASIVRCSVSHMITISSRTKGSETIYN